MTHSIGSSHTAGGHWRKRRWLRRLAAMLARRFERVTILERDVLPHGPDVRGGVPQGRHVHVLLARVQRSSRPCFLGFWATCNRAARNSSTSAGMSPGLRRKAGERDSNQGFTFAARPGSSSIGRCGDGLWRSGTYS